ncbi:hypothetical protein AVEN_47169-1 [Araneus ventricosus]|uniref:Uncharacterized protein n=1 Tax=Araneus ventricosus TaxID=182803 RepID=A0A4Y2N1Z2_ARAVE|nr:hypothetical protein AVEN_47169-1 [Araneus ventricosus]
MADEEMENEAPRSTSEATPPHVYDYPKMVSHHSPPEEERVTSSTDRQPPEIANSPDEQRVSSTSEQELPNDVGPSTERSDPVQKLEDQPEPDTTPYPILRLILEAQPLIIHSEAQTGDGQTGHFQKITRDAIEGNTDEEKSDDPNPQFDAEDLPSVSKSPSKNVDLGSSSPGNGYGHSGTRRRGAENIATEDAGARSDCDLPPITGTGTGEVNSSGISAIRNVDSRK